MKPTQHPTRQPGYRLEELDGELLLYHLDQTQIISCNQTASLIWQLCDGSRSVAEITQLLIEAYPEAEADIRRDVADTLAQFAQHGAILLSE